MAKVPAGTAKLATGCRRVRVLLLTCLLPMAACSGQDSGRPDPFSANGQVIAMGGGNGGPANACFTCHGLDGMGDGVSVPRLAGLDAGYLQKQLQDYTTGVREDPVMHEAARWLDDDDRRAVAAWYASLPPRGSPRPAPAPPSIWLAGDRTRKVAACADCHGVGGEGVGPGNPALAGQPAAYTVDQLERWKSARRRNDPRNIMKDAVEGLTAAEIAAIAVWLERMPAAPARATDAATASAAATAAARPEAFRGTRRPDR